jgi:hypothetical protein
VSRWRNALLAALALAATARASEPERWSGVDQRVVERMASEGGRSPWRSLLDQSGDLPLFLFTLAGLASGFALGYGYRALFSKPPSALPEPAHDQKDDS